MEELCHLKELCNQHLSSDASNGVMRYYMNAWMSSVSASVYVGPSDIHGKGVFAGELLESGMLVSYYPAHILAIPKRDAELKGPNGRSRCIQMPTPLANCKGMNDMLSLHQRCVGYELPVIISASSTAFQPVRILADPQYDDAKACAHMINDCAGPGLSDYEYEAARSRMNCELRHTGDGISFAVTTKIVRKGEELLTAYGNAYWKELEMFPNCCQRHINTFYQYTMGSFVISVDDSVGKYLGLPADYLAYYPDSD
jgi:hypothetical protein